MEEKTFTGIYVVEGEIYWKQIPITLKDKFFDKFYEKGMKLLTEEELDNLIENEKENTDISFEDWISY